MKNISGLILVVCVFVFLCMFFSGCADTNNDNQIIPSSIISNSIETETSSEETIIFTKNSETLESNKKTLKNKKETIEDPYNAKDYPNEDWFYEDYYDDFDSFEDAEDYYNEFYD